jgi:hypothetical protein
MSSVGYGVVRPSLPTELTGPQFTPARSAARSTICAVRCCMSIANSDMATASSSSAARRWPVLFETSRSFSMSSLASARDDCVPMTCASRISTKNVRAACCALIATCSSWVNFCSVRLVRPPKVATKPGAALVEVAV